jgi:hypothetical protein
MRFCATFERVLPWESYVQLVCSGVAVGRPNSASRSCVSRQKTDTNHFTAPIPIVILRLASKSDHDWAREMGFCNAEIIADVAGRAANAHASVAMEL